MSKTKAKLEDLYQIPCGVVGITADSVCRRSLRETMDKLLDRLTHEIHPYAEPDKLPKTLDAGEDGSIVEVTKETIKETPEEKKERLLEEGKIRAEVKMAVKSYEEQLQGNSKLLQDVSGVIEKW
jgi:hypothetical protein